MGEVFLALELAREGLTVRHKSSLKTGVSCQKGVSTHNRNQHWSQNSQQKSVVTKYESHSLAKGVWPTRSTGGQRWVCDVLLLSPGQNLTCLGFLHGAC